jgi:hypothetical protein
MTLILLLPTYATAGLLHKQQPAGYTPGLGDNHSASAERVARGTSNARIPRLDDLNVPATDRATLDTT